MRKRRGQASFEYLILMGFVTLVLAGILGIAFFYTSGIQDRVRINQVNNFASKVISAAEYIYSAGEPSKTTVLAYLPENVKNITIEENLILISIETSSGLSRIGFPSSVNITGEIPYTPGLKKLEVEALVNGARILPA